MHRIDTLTAVKDKFGPGKNGFTNGNLSTGRVATWLDSDMWDAIQEELCGVIEKAGIPLNKQEHDQLYQAIRTLVTSKVSEDALLKVNNGGDIPKPDLFVRNIGAARAFSSFVSIGGGGDWTTAEFIVWLENQGAFNHPYWMCKGSWSYGDNRVITDTGCGNIQLAGAVVEVMGERGAMTIRITTPTTTTNGIPGAQFTYINHGDEYLPGWRRDLRRSGDTMDGDLNLPNLYASGVVKSAGEIQTTSANSFRMVYGDYGAFWHQNGTYLYLMLTNRGDPYGSFNGLRSLTVNLATGDITMANGATIHGLKVQGNIGVGTDNALGGYSIVLGDNDTGFKQNGDGILDVYANGVHVFRFANGANNSIAPLRSESYISAKGGVYEFNGTQDVRVYSPHNPPPVPDLSGYATQQWVGLQGYATQSWVLQNTVQDIDHTAPIEVQFWDGRGYPRATDGAAMYNFNMVGGYSNVGNIQFRYTRKRVNGNWYIIN